SPRARLWHIRSRRYRYGSPPAYHLVIQFLLARGRSGRVAPLLVHNIQFLLHVHALLSVELQLELQTIWCLKRSVDTSVGTAETLRLRPGVTRASKSVAGRLHGRPYVPVGVHVRPLVDDDGISQHVIHPPRAGGKAVGRRCPALRGPVENLPRERFLRLYLVLQPSQPAPVGSDRMLKHSLDGRCRFFGLFDKSLGVLPGLSRRRRRVFRCDETATLLVRV